MNEAEFMAQEHPDPTEQPCNECPWRREAAPGWLGPHDAIDWIIAAHGEGAIACHKTIEGEDWTHQCRGAAIFREHIMKSPKNPTIVTGPEDRERVFATDMEFLDHHMRETPSLEELRDEIFRRTYT